MTTFDYGSIPDTPPCRCDYCVSCCHHKPGMFAPGEPERVAEHLGLTLKELFEKYLAVDVAHDQDRDTYRLVPATRQLANAGGIYRYREGGTCVFLSHDGRCKIQAVKPWECRVTDHAQTGFTRVEEAEWSRPWRAHQAVVEELVGRELPERAVSGIPEWNETRYTPPTASEAQDAV